MKNNIESISIPAPCSQQWAEMTPVNGGRHCDSCCKTVVDFIGMTNDEVIATLINRDRICGRFGTGQLTIVNRSLKIRLLPKPPIRKFGTAVLAAMLCLVKVTAAPKQLLSGHVADKDVLNSRHFKTWKESQYY